MSEFAFKEVDLEGVETLEVIAGADRFNRWMHDQIKPFCSGEILEVGSGIGNISTFFVDAGASITLSDIRENYCGVLRKKFPAQDVIKLDLVHPDFEKTYHNYLGKFDALFALNVVEHIGDDQAAVVNASKLLRAGGRLIILVPAYQFLYNRFDKELEHYRRYRRQSLNGLFEKAGLRNLKSWYFNFVGIPGWFVSGKLQGNKTIPKGQMMLYNKLVPLFRIVDRLVMNSAGLSVISVGQK